MKLLGALLAFAACIYAGLIKMRCLNEKENCLKAVSDCLLLTSNFMERTNDSLPDIFIALSKQCTGIAGAFFGALEEKIGNIGECSFSQIWNETIKKIFPGLDRREMEEISRLGFVLGRSDTYTQITEMRNCEQMINRTLGQLRNDLPKRKKLTMGLSATAGAFAVILLI